MNYETIPETVVASLLSDVNMKRKVRHAVRGRATLYEFPSWRGLADSMEILRPLGIFLDPAVDESADWANRVRQLQAIHRHKIILYTALSPALAQVLLSLGMFGIREVVFSRLDDYPGRLAEALESIGVVEA